MNPDSKVIVKYFILMVNGKEFEFNSASHAEQVLRGFVHSGYTVTIQEVTEVKLVTRDELDKYRAENVNWSYVDEPKMSENCCVPQETCNSPAGRMGTSR